VIDLHTHTTASDGRLTPEQLISLADDFKLYGIAVTDHDGIDGIARARAAAERMGISFVPGIEISAEYTESGTMHILGYFMDEADEGFNRALIFLKKARSERNPLIIERLNRHGIPLTMEDVRREAGSDQIGRPHFARAMVKKGYVASIPEAFERYIKKGGPCYVNKARLTPREAIRTIREAGGVAVLAHPKTLMIDQNVKLPRLLSDLVEDGLRGIECYYFNHARSEQEYYLTLTRRFNILATGGSDFHGDNKPQVQLGKGTGNLVVPDEVLDRLIAEKKEISAARSKQT
jgi:3',5'-nucleoside bisphosphate phosphatase